MKYLPLHLDFSGRRCVVIGGGALAERRARQLLEAGARVDLVALEAGRELRSLIASRGGDVALRGYMPGDVAAGYALAVAATDDEETNRRVAAEAARNRVPVNVAGEAARGDVIFPATVERAPLTISVASAAASPTLSRLLGARIEALVPAAYGELAKLVGKFRARAKEKIPDVRERARFWENMLQGAVAENVFSGNAAEAEAQLSRALESPSEHSAGEVYLIGAGPGDPDLLTLRALRLLQQADVVLYDRLVSPEILEKLGGELIHVGKRPADHTVAQPDINQMLSDYARAGKRVARLKGGDPFIFGRGGEEIAHLAGEGIPFQVIPGITAASGCACYAGIPLTHRDHAQSVRFVTGQLRDGGVDLDWPSLVAPMQTLVFYMSLRGLPLICENLQKAGMDASTPAALIEKGTTPRQKVHAGTLGDMGNLTERTEVRAPTIFIVGAVVSLRPELGWFEAGENTA
ncbi:MAG: siroheme synthase CysG [Gammaproteobacteria bacterium]|nr:siroheme synthase CysG [Gammaproteobacteria bacterium]